MGVQVIDDNALIERAQKFAYRDERGAKETRDYRFAFSTLGLSSARADMFASFCSGQRDRQPEIDALRKRIAELERER